MFENADILTVDRVKPIFKPGKQPDTTVVLFLAKSKLLVYTFSLSQWMTNDPPSSIHKQWKQIGSESPLQRLVPNDDTEKIIQTNRGPEPELPRSISELWTPQNLKRTKKRLESYSWSFHDFGVEVFDGSNFLQKWAKLNKDALFSVVKMKIKVT